MAVTKGVGMMGSKGWPVLVLGMAVCLLLPVWATGEEGSLFQKKATLVDRFLANSETAKRVAGAGHEGAKALLDKARVARDAAQQAHASGQEKPALDFLDQALKLVVEASRSSADPASQEWLYRSRYADLADSVRYFQETYQKYLEHADASKRDAANQTVQEAAAMTGTAARLAQEKRFGEANNTLTRAQGILIAGLQPLLGSRSLVYALKFDTPRQEYEYEVRRGESLEALIRMALAEKTGDVDVAAVQAFVAQGRAKQEQAQGVAAAGQFESAIRVQEEANTQLVRALRALGVMIPL